MLFLPQTLKLVIFLDSKLKSLTYYDPWLFINSILIDVILSMLGKQPDTFQEGSKSNLG